MLLINVYKKIAVPELGHHLHYRHWVLNSCILCFRCCKQLLNVNAPIIVILADNCKISRFVRAVNTGDDGFVNNKFNQVIVFFVHYVQIELKIIQIHT